MPTPTLLDHAKRIQALAQIGLTYSANPYDLERYEELKEIALQLMNAATGMPVEKLAQHYGNAREYATPKVDVRGVVVNDAGEILLVRESADGCWSLPGGWADIGYSPKEVIVKEMAEETGLTVTPTRLLAVMDKRKHAHPPALEYVYKLFIACTVTAGEIQPSHDILGCAYFAEDNLPELSLERVTPEQLHLMFKYVNEPATPVTLD
jgi:ADP-ribose pyrophosphatase YjhB (NUDIX family)